MADLIKVILTSFAIVLVSACNYQHMKHPSKIPVGAFERLTKDQQDKLSYSYIYSEVFLHNCDGCHGSAGGLMPPLMIVLA